MERIRLTQFVVLSVLLTSAPRAMGATPDERPITPCVIITGADSQVQEPRYLRITDLEDWAKLWMEHKGERRFQEYDWFYDPLTLPWVDFEHYMVIAVFLGSRTNIARLSLGSMTEDDSEIVLRYEKKSYQTIVRAPQTFASSGVKSNVFGFFVVPVSSKQIRIEEGIRGYKGKPPTSWEERMVLPPKR